MNVFVKILHRSQRLTDLILHKDNFYGEEFYDNISQDEHVDVYRARMRLRIRNNNKKGNYEYRTEDVPPREEEPIIW